MELHMSYVPIERITIEVLPQVAREYSTLMPEILEYARKQFTENGLHIREGKSYGGPFLSVSKHNVKEIGEILTDVQKVAAEFGITPEQIMQQLAANPHKFKGDGKLCDLCYQREDAKRHRTEMRNSELQSENAPTK
jgi:transposase-like protein